MARSKLCSLHHRAKHLQPKQSSVKGKATTAPFPSTLVEKASKACHQWKRGDMFVVGEHDILSPKLHLSLHVAARRRTACVGVRPAAVWGAGGWWLRGLLSGPAARSRQAFSAGGSTMEEAVHWRKQYTGAACSTTTHGSACGLAAAAQQQQHSVDSWWQHAWWIQGKQLGHVVAVRSKM